MPISTSNQLTEDEPVRFFSTPQHPLHRQYEALRAFFLDHQPSSAVARRFRYSPASFRVLCHQFRHDPAKREAFFRQPQRGPRSAPARDQVRDLVVAMRKRNLSVYDIQRELAAASHQPPDQHSLAHHPAPRRRILASAPPRRRGTSGDDQSRAGRRG